MTRYFDPIRQHQILFVLGESYNLSERLRIETDALLARMRNDLPSQFTEDELAALGNDPSPETLNLLGVRPEHAAVMRRLLCPDDKPISCHAWLSPSFARAGGCSPM